MEDDNYTRITLRIPKDLHTELSEAARSTSKSMNAEIVARLQGSPSNQSALVEAIARLNLDLARAEYAVEQKKRELSELSVKHRAALRLLNRTHFGADLEAELFHAEAEESPDERALYSPPGDALHEAIEKWRKARDDLEQLRQKRLNDSETPRDETAPPNTGKTG